MRKFDRPRYLFCWWCSRKLRGKAHELMTGPGHADPVVVHCECAEDMQLDGWQTCAAAAPVSVPVPALAV